MPICVVRANPRWLISLFAICLCSYLLFVHLLIPDRSSRKYPRDVLGFDEDIVSYSLKSRIEEKIERRTTDDRGRRITAILNSMESITERNNTDIDNLLIDEILSVDLSFVSNSSLSDNQTTCPKNFDIRDLHGLLSQAVLLIQNLKENEVQRRFPYLKPGGHWRPTQCIARHKYGNNIFNKGRLMNAAFTVALKMRVDCVIFHDVDMFPQNDHNSYGCPDSPRHIGAYVSNLGYQLWYDYIVGGVLAIRMNDFVRVNGYSNMYWAWGGEDDDMGKRILANNFTIERPSPLEGRFTMLKHVKRKRVASKLIYKLLESAGTRWTTDGFNNRDKWSIVKVIRRPLYYHMYVDVGSPPEIWHR